MSDIRYNNGLNFTTPPVVKREEDQYSELDQKNYAMLGHLAANFLPFGLLASAVIYFGFGKKGKNFFKKHMKVAVKFRIFMMLVGIPIGIYSIFSYQSGMYLEAASLGFGWACGLAGAAAARLGKSFSYPFTTFK